MSPELNGTKLEKIPISFQLGDNVIDGATVRPLSFQAFADCIGAAHGMKQPAAFEARLRRVRMAKQVSYSVNGTTIPVSMEDLLRLPIPEMHKILAKLDDNEGKAGKIIRDGDGINKAVVYELGTPIPVNKGDPIRELEFYAATYGEIEDVLSADTGVQQAMMLIKTVAKPLGSTLIRLPDWGLNVITVADGVTISNVVLPRFLASPGG